MSDNQATVMAIYEAFGRGDIPFILEQLADDVRWEHWAGSTVHEAQVPWLLPRTGRAGVGEFFQTISTWTFHRFEVVGVLEGERKVGVEVVTDAELPSGLRVQDEELHLWTFDGAGKVASFRHYVDTAKQIRSASSL